MEVDRKSIVLTTKQFLSYWAPAICPLHTKLRAGTWASHLPWLVVPVLQGELGLGGSEKAHSPSPCLPREQTPYGTAVRIIES